MDGDLVRHPSPPLVEDDQPAEGSEAFVKGSAKREVPPALYVRRPPGHDHEVNRAIADDLIGDVNVSALGILRLSSRGRFTHVRRGPDEAKSASVHGLDIVWLPRVVRLRSEE